MKITKNQFVDYMTNNMSHFCGIAKKDYTEDELYCILKDIIEKKSDEYIEMRTCKANSTDLIFNEGSYLRIVSNKYTKCEFYCFDYPTCKILFCRDVWTDDFDNKQYVKNMYYLIYK